MNQIGSDPYDFSVCDIDFIVLREPDTGWKLEQMINRGHYILAFALGGHVTYEYGGGTHPASAGDLLFFKKGEPHSAHSSEKDPWTFCSAAFDIIPFSDAAAHSLQALPTLSHVSYARYAERFREMHDVWNQRGDGFTLKCRAILSDLLYMLIHDTQADYTRFPHREALDRVRDYSTAQVGEALTTAELAAIADMSPSHFRMLFKQYTGMTTVQYQNQLRISRACSLLRSGGCNVTETALSLGFSDIYYFSRLFKKYTGVNPSVYSKQ